VGRPVLASAASVNAEFSFHVQGDRLRRVLLAPPVGKRRLLEALGACSLKWRAKWLWERGPSVVRRDIQDVVWPRALASASLI
jgi:hypothetical protein